MKSYRTFGDCVRTLCEDKHYDGRPKCDWPCCYCDDQAELEQQAEKIHPALSTPHQVRDSREEEAAKLRAENERLRDALADIADDNNPSPSDPTLAVKWFREIALKALKNECKHPLGERA